MQGGQEMESSVLNMPRVVPVRYPSGNVMYGALRKCQDWECSSGT